MDNSNNSREMAFYRNKNIIKYEKSNGYNRKQYYYPKYRYNKRRVNRYSRNRDNYYSKVDKIVLREDIKEELYI